MERKPMTWEELVAAGRERLARRARRVSITPTPVVFYYQAMFVGGKQNQVMMDATGTVISIWGSTELCGGRA